jgi:hypothetical protein
MTEMTPATQVFDVLLSRKDSVESGLVALAKRAARKGLPALVWTWGKAYSETVVRTHEGGAEEKIKVTRVPLSLVCVELKFAGWTFVAALQHMDGENIVRTVGDQELPVMYRTRGPACDHCKHDRRRNDTYVLVHDSGKFVQVGSTCIDDFLGGDDAATLAARACLLADARGLGEGGEEGGLGGGGGSGASTLSEYLPIVAWDVRTLGWVSRSVAKDTGKLASADNAWVMMIDSEKSLKAKCEPSAEDIALGAAAEAWAESLTDAVVDASKGDYLHNLRAVARTGLVTSRTCGIAASMVTAYQRFLGDERKRAERAARPNNNAHVGVVGKRQTFVVTLDFVTGYESTYGYTTVLKFVTDAGETLVWKASSTELARADVGKRFELTGFVKKHDEYKGQKQTMINRCKVVEVEPVADSPAAPKATALEQKESA